MDFGLKTKEPKYLLRPLQTARTKPAAKNKLRGVTGPFALFGPGLCKTEAPLFSYKKGLRSKQRQGRCAGVPVWKDRGRGVGKFFVAGVGVFVASQLVLVPLGPSELPCSDERPFPIGSGKKPNRVCSAVWSTSGHLVLMGVD